MTACLLMLGLALSFVSGCNQACEVQPITTQDTAAEISPAASDPLEPALTKPDFRSVVRQAKDKVFPAVVFIKCLRESHESGKRISQEVTGSGVLISPEGELLTNWHVVDKAVEIRCLLHDGRSFHAEALGTDKDTDLALVKLKLTESDGPVPYADLGDSTVLREGDFVMAMGAPWGLSRSVSIGIVSCTRRYLPDHSEYSHWLQTDASISPGNSGGPLVNTDGQVVGINALAAMSGGDMGFAIPAATVSRIVERLRVKGKMDWSWTGIQLQPLRDFERDVYFDATEGVIVAETDPDSPARRAGLMARDRIVRINGVPVTATTAEDLPALRVRLGTLTKDAPASLELVRNDQEMSLELTPREKGRVEGEELDCPRWDLTVKAINQFDNPDLHFHRKKGVFVFGVKYPGNASQAGLDTKDILLKIGDHSIETLDDVRQAHSQAMENLASDHKVLVTVLRNGLMRQMILDFSRDYEKE